MKKFYLLLFVLLFTSLHVLAIDKTTNMNPFAYGLEAILSADQQTMTVKYSLNADARTVKIVFLDGSTVLKTISCTGSLLNKTPNNVDPYISANKHSIDIPISDLPANTDLTWRIEVTGDGRAATEVYSQDGTSVYRYKFYRPSSVDIVQDPTSYNYGKVLVVECQHTASTTTGYHSSPMTKTNGNTDKQGAGIYVFNPDLTPRHNASGTYVFNGNSDSRFSSTEYAPYRVRVSEDGRIFVSSLYKDGNILWEVPPTFGTWTTVIGKDVAGTTWVGKKSSTGDYDTDYCLNTSNGSFIAAPNAGLDVRGKGSNLQILLLSCTGKAFGNSQLGFHTYQYNLGTAKTWSNTPSKDFKTSSSTFVSVYTSNVQYDKDGGIWCISYRGSCSESQPALVHKSASVVEDYRNSTRNNTKNAGLRFNKDFTRAVMASAGSKAHLYDYIPSRPDVYFFNEVQIDMSAVGSHMNDFAWDNANNVYAVGHQTTGDGYVAMYCLPYKSTDVFSTSAPSTFSIDCNPNTQYNVIMLINDTDMGSVSGGGAYTSCTDVTLTATPKDGYRFVNWTVGGVEVSKDAVYTFSITENLSIQANFAPNVFNVEWYGLFQNHEDITDPSLDAERNARLWRLFQVEYNKHAGTSQIDMGEATNTKSGSTRYMYYVLKFVNTNFGSYDTPSERCALIESFLDDDSNPSNFYWLGQYIESVVGRDDINKYFDGTYTTNIWGFYLQSFINRTRKSHNQSFETATDVGKAINGDYKVVDFSEASKPERWRSYWTEHACELPKTYNYGMGLPKDWNWYELPVGWSIADAANSKTIYNPCDTWCKWNNQEANPGKLLAWYYDDKNNPTWPTNPTIVRSVYQSGALFATWVEKLVSEEKTIQNNSDAIWLLNYHNGTHDIKILRKMQGGMYNTLCLPFSATKAQQPSVLQNATIVQFTGVNENLYDDSGEPVVELQFTKVDDIVAGVPYLVMPQTDITSEMTFTNIPTGYNGNTPLVMETAQEITKSTNNGSISFIGNIHPTNIPAQSLIVVANSRLAEVTEAGDIQHMRGYFRIDDAQLQTLSEEGKVYLSMRKPTTTSVPLAPEAVQPVQPKVRKVMHDGKIYILRGDEVYTITGNRVR